MIKVLYITNLPTPYRVKFFNQLGNKTELTVLYERSTANNRNSKWLENDGYSYKDIFMNGIKFKDDQALNFEVIKYINEFRDRIIIVGGYSTPTGMLAIYYMKMKGIKFIINADGGLIKQDSFFKYKLKSFLISSANYWLSSSRSTSEYLSHYGADINSTIEYSFSSVEKKNILKSPMSFIDKARLRKKLDINEEHIILYVGQMIHRKGIDILLESLIDKDETIGVYLIGGGVLPEYEEIIRNNSISNIYFIDFIPNNDLQDYYKVADLFILPTREDIWGLVINEAMAMGLPIITTKSCVAGLELVKNGVNGFLINSDNPEELKVCYKEIIRNDPLRRKMSNNSLSIIGYHTIENMVQQHLEFFSIYQQDTIV